MEYGPELMDFINSPDAVDFIARKSEYLLDAIKRDPQVFITQTLLDRFILGYVHRDHYDALFSLFGTGVLSTVPIILGPLNQEILDSSGITQIHKQPYLDLKGGGVLFGIVDTGIDYTQPPFVYPDGTSKIQSIYDQTAIGTPPYDFTVGVEYTNEQINAALRSERPFDLVPETDTLGHGTFLASVAAGRQVGDFIGAAPEAEIIAVKLRGARPYYRDRFCVPPDQQYAYEASAIMVGVEYIIEKAIELGRPVSICIGLGSNFGGHNGTSILEEYLGIVANLKGVCLCVAAGNESQAGHHTQGRVSASGETQNIDIRVGEQAGNIGISLWNTVSDRFSVSIRSPSGELVSRVPPKIGPDRSFSLILEPTTVTVKYFFPIEFRGGQLTYIRLLDASPGIWTIIIHGDLVLDGSYHAYLPLTGFVAEGVEFLSPSPYYTVTVPATKFGLICCGAYDSFEYKLYPKSSWGPTREPVLVPDFVAPGVNVSGYTSLGLNVMSGTSMAAAITAGACALFLQWGIVKRHDVSISTNQIRAYLIRGCDKSDEISYPNPQWGYGTLNVLQSFSFMREV